MKYAGFGIRLLAHFIDNTIIVLVSILMLVFLVIGAFLENSIVAIIFFILFFAVDLIWWILNDVFFVVKKGASVGKLLVGLRIVDEEKNNLTYGKAFIRTLVKSLLFIFSIIGALGYSITIFTQDDKQSLGDMAAKSYVVHK
ncbi:RDD family protein [Nanoarchaeota archaeon]